MNILDGVTNFLWFVNNNWTTIIVIIGLLIAVFKRIKNYFSKSNEEKIKIAKKQIQEIVLKLVADAEVDYKEWAKSGAIKRAQVVDKIFAMYPVLEKVSDQNDVIAWVDEVIDSALNVMKEVVSDGDKQISDAANNVDK